MPHSRRLSRAQLHDTATQKLELLLTPICRLGLRIRGTVLEGAVRQLKEDALRAGITKLEPHFYLADAYGTVEGTANIAMGFYDTRPLLQELNDECRGWRHSLDDIMLTMRHELGHAFCYSYKLYRTPEFREMFRVKGHFFRTYPDRNRFRPNPWSRDFVNPAGDHYAQKHPDDDFAETFAVWLNPGSQWWEEYRNRPGALRKLEYVGEIVAVAGKQDPEVANDPTVLFDRVEDMKMTLAQFFKARTGRYRRPATGYVDQHLCRMFRPRPRSIDKRALAQRYTPAAALIEELSRSISAAVCAWVRIDELAVRDLLDKCATRSRALDLWVRIDSRDLAGQGLCAYVTRACDAFARTGKFFAE